MVEDKYLPDLVPLTAKETTLREKLEKKVFTTVREFYIELGAIFDEIYLKELFKSTHHSFSDYSNEVLDMAKESAFRYIRAYQVVKNLCGIEQNSTAVETAPIGVTSSNIPLPQNESQARALVELTPEEQRQVWQQAIETAPEGKITAAHIRKTVRVLKGTKTTAKVNEAKEGKEDKKPRAKNKSRIDEGFQKAFNVFLEAVQKEIDTNWKTTDRLTVINHLDGIRGAISENGNHCIPEKGYAIEACNTEKLQAAGFEIYRANKIKMIIERLVKGTDWEVHSMFEDTEVLDKVFDELLLEKNNLRGYGWERVGRLVLKVWFLASTDKKHGAWNDVILERP